MKFAYRQYRVKPSPTAPIGILYRPEIPLRVIGADGAMSTSVMLDSGSDDTLFPLSLAHLVGASFDKSQTWTLEGFGGKGSTGYPWRSYPGIDRWRTNFSMADKNRIRRFR